MATEYSKEIKAAAMAALLAGQSVSAVAKEFEIPKGTVSYWKMKAAEGVGVSPTQKREEIGELLTEYVKENLLTLRAQARFFRDENWLREQDASAVAVLHGVMMDKETRLLEMLSRATAD